MKDLFLRVLLGVAVLLFQFSAYAEMPTPSKPELLLVYWSAKDCRWCTYWESSWSGMETRLKNSDEFNKVTYRVIKSERLADRYADEHFPNDIRWLKERIDRGVEKPLGRPGWGFYVDRTLVAKFYGTQDWDTKHLPTILQLVGKYSADGQLASSAEPIR